MKSIFLAILLTAAVTFAQQPDAASKAKILTRAGVQSTSA